jgi:hypothetical protein
MIRYRVACDQSHEWDAWFDSSSSFDRQVAANLVECPICGSTKTGRAIMAPAVQGTRKRGRALARVVPETPTTDAPVNLTSGPDSLVLPPEVRTFFDGLRQHIAASHDDVGDTFAREARAIHEGEVDARPIIGTATPKEARELVEDGVPILPVPKLIAPTKLPKLN